MNFDINTLFKREDGSDIRPMALEKDSTTGGAAFLASGLYVMYTTELITQPTSKGDRYKIKGAIESDERSTELITDPSTESDKKFREMGQSKIMGILAGSYRRQADGTPLAQSLLEELQQPGGAIATYVASQPKPFVALLTLAATNCAAYVEYRSGFKYENKEGDTRPKGKIVNYLTCADFNERVASGFVVEDCPDWEEYNALRTQAAGGGQTAGVSVPTPIPAGVTAAPIPASLPGVAQPAPAAPAAPAAPTMAVPGPAVPVTAAPVAAPPPAAGMPPMPPGMG